MAYYIKANHISGQIIISAVDESIGYESVQATIALDCDTSITAKSNQDTLFLVSDNGEQYHLYFPIVKAFNNGVEQTIANLAALDAWASGHKSTACSAGGGGGGGELVGDTSPQLGGDLDLNFYDIVAEDVTIDAAGSNMTITLDDADDYSFAINNGLSTLFAISSVGGSKTAYIAGPLTILGNIDIIAGTLEGRYIGTDGAKLDTIEPNADVTDESNVVAALSGATLSDIETPASNDKVLIQDADDSDSLKYVSFSAFGGGSGGWDPNAAETLTNKTISGANNTFTNIDHGDLVGKGDDDHTQYAIISTGTEAPSSTPARPGAIYIDTAGAVVYKATGSSSSADWQKMAVVDETGVQDGQVLVWDNNNSKWVRDPKEENANEVTAFDVDSMVGNEYSFTTASTASSYTINNVKAGGKATIRIQESTAGGPAFAGSGLTITKKGDWATNYDTTNVNTIFLKAVTATLIEAYIASVDA